MGLLIGYENEKREIAQLKDMLRRADVYRSCGLRIPRGLVLYGSPGVGKTVLARSIVEGTDTSLVELRAADCCDGNVQGALQRVFSEAKEKQPSVILLDELDKIAGTSDCFFMEENSDIQKMLLQALDSLSDSDTVLVVATCNDMDVLGNSLMRSGRFDRQINVRVPDEETREQILRAYFDRLKLDKDLDYEYVAHLISGYTGAKIECLVNEVGILALQDGLNVITVEQVRSVMNRLAFSGGERKPVKNPQKRRMVAVHEAGHTVVAMALLPDGIFGASILPQGNSNGHTRFVGLDDEIRTVREEENEVAVLLAGHVAERVALGEYAMGANLDLHRAHQRLENLTLEEGVYGYEGVCGLVAPQMSIGDGYSDGEVANRIVCEKMKELDAKAEKIIQENREFFDTIVERLMQEQILSRSDLVKLKDQFAIKQAA